MDEDDGSAGCTDVDECATGTHNCESFYGADDNGNVPGAPECVNHDEGFTCNCPSGFWAQEGRICLDVGLTLTNATLITDHAMKMSTASMMYDHTAAHVMPVGIPLTAVQLALTLMNMISLVMMPSAIM